MSSTVYIIEDDQAGGIIDICSSEELAIKSLKYWVHRNVEEERYSSVEEAKTYMRYKAYETDQNIALPSVDDLLVGEYSFSEAATSLEEVRDTLIKEIEIILKSKQVVYDDFHVAEVEKWARYGLVGFLSLIVDGNERKYNLPLIGTFNPSSNFTGFVVEEK